VYFVYILLVIVDSVAVDYLEKLAFKIAYYLWC